MKVTDGKASTLRLLSSRVRLKGFYCTGISYYSQHSILLTLTMATLLHHGQAEWLKTHRRLTWTLFTLGLKSILYYNKSHQLWKAIPFDSFQMTSWNGGWYTAVNLMRNGPLMHTVLAEHNFNKHFQQIRIIPWWMLSSYHISTFTVPRNQIPWFRLFGVFHNPSSQMPRQHLTLGDCFLQQCSE